MSRKKKKEKKKMLGIYRRHVPSRKRYLTLAGAPVVVNEWLVRGGACCGLLYCGVGASAVHMWARAHQCGRRCVPWGPHNLHGAPRRTCRACNVFCPATKLRHFLPPSSLHQHSQPATHNQPQHRQGSHSWLQAKHTRYRCHRLIRRMSSGGPPAIDFVPPGSDDLAFWAGFAAVFREKFGNMVRYQRLHMACHPRGDGQY